MKMKIIINVKENESAISQIDEFKKKKYIGKDIRFTNVDMIVLNETISKPIFYKNDLFISSETLWEIMQPLGEANKHNYHELTAKDIVEALNSINKPYALFETKNSRYAIVTTTMSHFNEPLLFIIEVGSGLYANFEANINKIVTIYPKSNVDIMLNGLDSKDVLYIKKIK
jgi:hypothetical protein